MNNLPQIPSSGSSVKSTESDSTSTSGSNSLDRSNHSRNPSISSHTSETTIAAESLGEQVIARARGVAFKPENQFCLIASRKIDHVDSLLADLGDDIKALSQEPSVTSEQIAKVRDDLMTIRNLIGKVRGEAAKLTLQIDKNDLNLRLVVSTDKLIRLNAQLNRLERRQNS